MRPSTLIVDGRGLTTGWLCVRRGSKSVHDPEELSQSEAGAQGTPRSPEAIERDYAMFPARPAAPAAPSLDVPTTKRETIAFGRTARIDPRDELILLAVWKNFIKSRSERRPDRITPAMRLGLTDVRWRFERVLCRRLFPRARAHGQKSPRRLLSEGLTRHLPELSLKHAA